VSQVLVALALVVAAPGPKDKPAALDLAGEWEITAYILGGKEVPSCDHFRFATDGTATIFGPPPEEKCVGEYTLNLKRSPATVDIVFPGAMGAIFGIVKREGDDLVLCFGPTDARPTKFESPAGSGVRLLTLKRLMPKD
jgi:uncharacterized protein (TIGR03067 family)